MDSLLEVLKSDLETVNNTIVRMSEQERSQAMADDRMRRVESHISRIENTLNFLDRR